GPHRLCDATGPGVTSRPGPTGRREKRANEQPPPNSGLSTAAPPEEGNAQTSASCAFPRAYGSLLGGRNTRCRPYRQCNMAMRHWYGKRIHADVMVGWASQWLKASGSAEAARPLMFGSSPKRT